MKASTGLKGRCAIFRSYFSILFSAVSLADTSDAEEAVGETMFGNVKSILLINFCAPEGRGRGNSSLQCACNLVAYHGHDILKSASACESDVNKCDQGIVGVGNISDSVSVVGHYKYLMFANYY